MALFLWVFHMAAFLSHVDDDDILNRDDGDDINCDVGHDDDDDWHHDWDDVSAHPPSVPRGDVVPGDIHTCLCPNTRHNTWHKHPIHGRNIYYIFKILRHKQHFWYPKLGTFGKSARFQVAKNGIFWRQNHLKMVE